MYFHAPRPIALRGGDRNEVTSKTENKRGMLMRRACARIDYSRCETPIAAYDERARKNGYEHKMRRIEFVISFADVAR